ncbi:ABC transporter permease [Planctomycetota bacterium]
MTTLINDIKYSLRQLAKSPGFTVVAMLTLSLGIGANLALFGILNEMLLRPKPVARPHELWQVVPARETGTLKHNGLIYRPFYEAVQREEHGFKDVIAYASFRPKLRTEEGSEQLYTELVAGNYFSFLGITPILGRGFYPEEDTPLGVRAVTVLSYAYWKNQFGAAQDVVGETVILNEVPVEIVGVAPKGFSGLDITAPCMWMPSCMESILGDSRSYTIVGRLTEPKLVPAVEERLSPLAEEVTEGLLASRYPLVRSRGVSMGICQFRLKPMGRGLLASSRLRPKVIRFLQFSGIATVLLLAIACANVAGLFLARALQRRKETATRVALGATRWDVIRPIMCEGVLVAAGGSLGALITFAWVSRIMMQYVEWWPGAPLRVMPDVRVLLFCLGAVFVVGFGFSLLPALQASRFNPSTALKASQGASRHQQWLRHGLIITQVVGSFVLLCGALLCFRSMGQQLSLNVGYDHDRLASVSVDLEQIGYTQQSFAPKLRQIIDQVKRVPGVEQVTACGFEPLAGKMGLTNSEAWVPEGHDGSHETRIDYGVFRGLTPGVFDTMGIPIRHGREFSQEDMELGHKHILVNECFVQTFWPGQNPLGKHILHWTVIGVVQDAHLGQFNDEPIAAIFRRTKPEILLHSTLLIRTTGNTQRVLGSVRKTLTRIHPKLGQGEMNSMRDRIKSTLAIQHSAMRVLTTLGILSLVLAAVGTYAVIAHVVHSQTRDIGIRLAVGASGWDIKRFVLSMGLRLGLAAMGIGLPLSVTIAKLLQHQIEGISPFDPVSFMVGIIVVLAALFAACWLPACHAARVDPMEALRYE